MRTFKTVIFALAVICTFSVARSSFASNKIDPLLEIMAAKGQSAASGTMKALGVKSVDGQIMVEALVKTGDDVSAAIEAIEASGGKVGAVIGNVLTIKMPLQLISQLENEPDIIYVEAAKPLSVKMNYARDISRVAEVQDGTGTGGTPYNGSGTIVGIVDSGIDCQHADFFDGTTPRIYAYWDQTTGTTGVPEIAGSTGTQYTGDALAIGGDCRYSPDSSGHGTHVAGIAAGSASSPDSRYNYTGVAPQSNLVVVHLNESGATSGTSGPLATHILEGVQYIFKKAQTLRKPAVVNLSIGTSLGAHDGTSLLETGLDNLLIETGTTEKQGRSIINAVGNENALYNRLATLNDNIGGIHAAISQSGGVSKAYEVYSTNDTMSLVGGTYLDIWLTADSTCTIGINARTRPGHAIVSTMTPVAKGSSNKTSPTKAGTVSMYVDFSESVSSLNGMQHAVGLISSDSLTNPQIASYSYDLVFTGNCVGNAWIYYDVVEYNYFNNSRVGSSFSDGNVTYTYVAGDSNSTATIPSTANKVIAVGSFMARDTYVDINDVTRSQQDVSFGSATDISTFSSLGPTAEISTSSQRIKPDLTAPGEPIISTLSSAVSPSVATDDLLGDSTHWKMQGSSMASPHVAGIVALMLEKNGCLRPATIKATLLGAADSDSETGAVPNETWGYGKVDATSAVNDVTAATCSPDNPADDGCLTDDDCPSGYSCVDTVCQKNTSNTCNLSIGRGAMATNWTDIFAALFGLALIVAVRVRKHLFRTR